MTLMSDISKNVQRAPRLYRQWRSSAGLTALVAALLCLAWSLTYLHIAPDMSFIAAENERLQLTLKSTARRMKAAQDHAAVTEREADVLRQANSLLRESDLHRQSELTLLRADLDFYRRLGGASDSKSALAVYHIERLATDSDRVHRLVFTLTQNLRWASMAKGQVQMRLEGVQADRPAVLEWNDLTSSAGDLLEFQFKYFQQLEFMLTLPAGFSPTRLTVQLSADILDRPQEQSFEWSALEPVPGSHTGIQPTTSD
jgi:hypothetical protein